MGSIDESVPVKNESLWFEEVVYKLPFVLPFVTVVHENLHRARNYRIRQH